MHSANFVGYAALILWPIVSLVVFSLARPAVTATALLVGGALLLPVGLVFDAVALPPLGKNEIASLSTMVCFAVFYPKRLTRAKLGRNLEILVLVLVVAGIGTALTNRDPLVYGPTRLPALAPYDAVSMGVRDLLRIGLPFVIGRTLVQSTRDVRDLFSVLLVAALLYTIPAIFEMRMSQVLHRWVYGYYTGSWSFRSGTYRPIVFMDNGLELALFFATSVVAGTAISRARIRISGLSMAPFTAYLAAVLVMCKSFAAIGYALVMAPIAALLRPRVQLRIAVVLSLLTLLYPLSRTSGWFPTAELVSIADSVSPDRAESLAYRFTNEDKLLAKALERPLFGWGEFRRARVFNPIRGQDISTTDGYWIIVLGSRGLLGFLATFGLLVLPVLLAYRRLGSIRTRHEKAMVAALALIVAINTIDLLPNGLFSYLPFLFSGSLLGVVQGVKRSRSKSGRHPSARSRSRLASLLRAEEAGARAGMHGHPSPRAI